MMVKGKLKIVNRARFTAFICILLCVIAVTLKVIVKGNEPKVIGYTYATGNTIWDIANEHCPDGMDIRELVREIRKINRIEDAGKYNGRACKVPVYELSEK